MHVSGFLNKMCVWCHGGLWLPKVLFVQVAVIHLLQIQHFRQTGGSFAAHSSPQGGKLQLCV